MNLSNPRDLRRLRELFPGQEVYLVVGSDVVGHASAYQAAPVDWSVHSMDHIIFRRAGQPPLPEGKELGITGKVIQLQLPPHLEDISSTRIRENVDMNRDISTFIDPVIQDFIYQNGLYLRDTQDKPCSRPGPVLPVGGAARTPCWWPMSLLGTGSGRACGPLSSGTGTSCWCCATVGRAGSPMLGWLSFRYLSTADLYSAFQNADLADQVRLRAGGKTLFITGLAAEEEQEKDYAQLLVSEVLSHALEAECVYAVFHPHEGLCPRRQRSSSGGRASSAGMGGRWRPICGPRWCCSRIWRPPFRSP